MIATEVMDTGYLLLTIFVCCGVQVRLNCAYNNTASAEYTKNVMKKPGQEESVYRQDPTRKHMTERATQLRIIIILPYI